MSSVLITGITGFTGAKIAELLIKQNIQVVGLKRRRSDNWRSKEFEDRISWIDLDGEENWMDLAAKFEPKTVIHCAWIGVEAADRDNYMVQSRNIDFLVEILSFCEAVPVNKIIFLGSQAEYGTIDSKVTENYPANPTSAYGAVKLASLEILRAFCNTKGIKWHWLRVFSLFGEKQGMNWLIPSVVKRLQTSKHMDLTLGEQKYAYLYIEDFAGIICDIIANDIESGVYNISSNELIQLRTLIEKIKYLVNNQFTLNFGAIPYRSGQSMCIEGDITNIEQQIGKIQFTEFDVALKNTIEYYTLNKVE